MNKDTINLQMFLASTRATDELSHRYNLVLSEAIRRATNDMYAAVEMGDEKCKDEALMLVDLLSSLQARFFQERSNYAGKLKVEYNLFQHHVENSKDEQG